MVSDLVCLNNQSQLMLVSGFLIISLVSLSSDMSTFRRLQYPMIACIRKRTFEEITLEFELPYRLICF